MEATLRFQHSTSLEIILNIISEKNTDQIYNFSYDAHLEKNELLIQSTHFIGVNDMEEILDEISDLCILNGIECPDVKNFNF